MGRPVIAHIKTRQQAQRRAFVLVGMLAVLQFCVDAAEPFSGRFLMRAIRVVAAAVAGTGAMRFEISKVRR